MVNRSLPGPHVILFQQLVSLHPHPKDGVCHVIKNMMETLKNNGKKALPVEFDWKAKTLQPVGKNGKMLIRLIGNTIKSDILPCIEDWAHVPLELRNRLLATGHIYFNIRGNMTEQEYQCVLEGLRKLMAYRYRSYKTNAHAHYITHGVANPYRNISLEDWIECVEFWNTPKFLRDPITGEWMNLPDCF